MSGLRSELIKGGDPRPWFAALLGAYLVCGLVFLGFARTPWQVLMVVGLLASGEEQIIDHGFHGLPRMKWLE